MPGVYISNIGMVKFGKHDGPLSDQITESVNTLIEYDRPSFIEPDAIFLGSMNPEQFIHEGNFSTVVTDKLGFTPAPSIRVETASSTGAAVIQMGVMAVASGIYDNVLVVAGEKMTDLDTPSATEVLAGVISENERKYGATMTALAALITRRYMHDYGLTREILSKVAVKSHHNGSLNPYAHFQKEISIEKANESRFVAEPLRLFDCSPISDGAAAVLLTSRKTDISIAGLGHSTDRMELRNRDSLTSFKSNRNAAKKAFEMAGLKPVDVNVAELHDAFTPFELISAEDMGFFEAGGAVSAVDNEDTTLSGDLPINPSGGLKSRGHPVGVSGLAQIIELVWQLRSEAGRRQVDAPKIGLAQSTGGIANNNLVTILKKS